MDSGMIVLRPPDEWDIFQACSSRGRYAWMHIYLTSYHEIVADIWDVQGLEVFQFSDTDL